jgi:hypothetical protein
MVAAITVLGYEGRPERNYWFDEERKTALTLKNQAYKAWLSQPTHIKRTEYEKQKGYQINYARRKRGST